MTVRAFIREIVNAMRRRAPAPVVPEPESDRASCAGLLALVKQRHCVQAIVPVEAIKKGQWLLHWDLMQCPNCGQRMQRTLLYVALDDDDVLVEAMTLWPDAPIDLSTRYLWRKTTLTQ